MRISFVKAPWWVRYCPPYILAYFAALLREKGHEVFLHDLNSSMYHRADSRYRKYWDDRDYYALWEDTAFAGELLTADGCTGIAEVIADDNPRIVAFTTHTPNTVMSMLIAEKLKKISPETVIVFMGHKASRAQMASDFIKQGYIDYVCPGEADLALQELVEKIDGMPWGSELPECRGFLSKSSGRIIDGGNPEPVGDLDGLPFPDYSDFRQSIENSSYSQPNRLDVLDSRGCINGCHFCYERLFWQKYRSMSGRRIYEQIAAHQRDYPGIEFFYFNGLLLNGDLGSLEEFCDLVIENGMDIEWAGQAVARSGMTAELLAKMKKAGCSWLYYGIESGSQRVLDSMNKKHRVEDAIRVLKDTRAAGINAQINIMFGYPTETEEDFGQTLEFLERVQPYIENVLASQSFCTLEKETYLRSHPEKFGITGGDHHLYWKSQDGKNDYAERFRRYERFCEKAIELGIPETSGVFRKKPDKWLQLGDFYSYDGNYAKAAECFHRSVEEETVTRSLLIKAAVSFEKAGDLKRAEEYCRRGLEFHEGEITAEEKEELERRLKKYRRKSG